MPIQRLTAAAALLVALLLAAPAQASPDTAIPAPSVAAPQPLLGQMPVLNPAQALAQSTLPTDIDRLLHLDQVVGAGSELRQALVSLAMQLRDIRYVRGGRDPSTGFDCSGFVRYVFAHAIGLELPANSAAQFLAGLKIRRDEMQPGDLVFFRTGRRGISHVGIYLDNGRFIHSPSRGKSVEVSSLDEAYWAKHFAGARRPEGIARNG
ncbi:C40 family peptidase [Fulvimonas soli]|jgi:cell wall-associated NlpC family hydrolase|uniref:Cell wall-associated NlpC family hydrolase n=1 Tax=Fulvimonas soli TaxID=155197 RepID=A0A316INR4_9GAMM|nr:C40 family peptidase [Fulvimonas soli]PWK92108.1 cell wall-associated NlpC family hydrolase [Fulvimonas soli]TNY27838.1 hydrolase [Fulvimonas soli]